MNEDRTRWRDVICAITGLGQQGQSARKAKIPTRSTSTSLTKLTLDRSFVSHSLRSVIFTATSLPTFSFLVSGLPGPTLSSVRYKLESSLLFFLIASGFVPSSRFRLPRFKLRLRMRLDLRVNSRAGSCWSTSFASQTLLKAP